MHHPLALIDHTPAVTVKQRRELSEIALGFDVANRYEIADASGTLRGEVLEEANGLTGMLFRNLLSTWRPLRMHVRDEHGQEVAELRKSFSLFFHKLDVFVQGVPIGSIQRMFSLLGRKYDVRDASGALVARIRRPLFRLWQYPVYDLQGTEIARIGKRWGGLLTELFTDADTYGVHYTDAVNPRLRTLLFAAMFLIDMTNTEDNANSQGLLG